jgi:hypothetical protein
MVNQVSEELRTKDPESNWRLVNLMQTLRANRNVYVLARSR